MRSAQRDINPEKGTHHMKNHRHLTALVPVMLLVAAGCSSGNGNASDTTSAAGVTTGGDAATTAAASGAATTGASASGEKITIVASVPPTDHGWLGAISKNAKAAAEQHSDVEFQLLEAADADSQAQQIVKGVIILAAVLVQRPERI